jgi:glycosyltransferase involved in cell wall biosynthesis
LVSNIPGPQLKFYYSSADLLLLTSFHEGSPNVIKEAMACNCPVVSTEVGDVRFLFGESDGHFISSFDPSDVAEKIQTALEYSQTTGRTGGNSRIIQLGLDSERIAEKIIKLYNNVLLN